MAFKPSIKFPVFSKDLSLFKESPYKKSELIKKVATKPMPHKSMMKKSSKMKQMEKHYSKPHESGWI